MDPRIRKDDALVGWADRKLDSLDGKRSASFVSIILFILFILSKLFCFA